MLNENKFQSILKFFEKRHKMSKNDVVFNKCLAMMMFARGNTDEDLLKNWKSAVQQDRCPTKQKIASLSALGLITVPPSGFNMKKFLKKVNKPLVQDIVEVSFFNFLICHPMFCNHLNFFLCN